MRLHKLWCEDTQLGQTIIHPKSGGPPVKISIGDKIIMKTFESSFPYSNNPTSSGWKEDYKGRIVDISRKVLENGYITRISIEVDYGYGGNKPIMRFYANEILNLFVLPS